MIRSAADLETPNNGASCRRVRFVRQYADTSRNLSSSGRPQGRPLLTGSAPSRRNAVTIFVDCRGLSPVNGAIQKGSDAVITPATARSSHLDHASGPAASGGTYLDRPDGFRVRSSARGYGDRGGGAVAPARLANGVHGH